MKNNLHLKQITKSLSMICVGGGHSLLNRAKRLTNTLSPTTFLLFVLISIISSCEAKKDDTPISPVPKTFTLTFDTQGGTEVPQQTIKSGEKAQKPTTPTREGYVFEDWYQEKDFKNTFDFTKETITTNTIVYAKWRINSFTLTFNSKAGTEVAQQTVKSGEKAQKPTDPTRDDYLFEGWYKEEALTTLFDFTKETITANLTLYAKWKKADISFSMRAVASSLELEVKTALSLTDMGAIIRLATEAVPTSTEAQASKGYVSLSIDADSTRKFSISQHYSTDFSDGLTLADVLTPNMNYKLYLYMPSSVDLGQIGIKGGEIKENSVEISFTTASLPPSGNAVWSENFEAREYTASLNQYHFMENQTGVFVSYFQLPFVPPLMDTKIIEDDNSSRGVGSYNSGTVTPASRFYYGAGVISDYPSTMMFQYIYSIGADKVTSSTLKNYIKVVATPQSGLSINYTTVVERY